MLEFHILGPLEVVEQERPIGLGGPRQRALLAILLLRRGEVVSSDRLIDQVWGERPPATAAKTLQGYPIDHCLTPGVPGYSDVHIYPATPDVAKARQLARGRAGTTAVLYTCNAAPCDQQAQIIKTDLAAIGMRVKIKAFAVRTLFTKEATPGEPFDIGLGGWRSDYPDPVPTLNLLLEGGTAFPTLDDRAYAARLAAAARLTGPRRYLTYARLDADLARDAAPLVAYGNPASHELFSARMGCQTYGVYGLDLAALCVKRGTR